ncbi:MAG: phosphate acyltransferase PlsX [Clostridia bacterium]|nr:phosphate acyltransferase PlsX [Clostridia bacterium]
MKILLDIAGADKGLSVPINAAVNIIDKIGCSICLVGKKEDIVLELKKLKKEEYLDKFEIIECTEYITNNDEPALAIKHKKESNLVKAFDYLKNNEDVVFISASNTGALMAGALLKVGRIPKVHRPALITLLPKVDGTSVVFLDSGANPQAKEISLIQYAALGKIYAKYMLSIDEPKIGLLNIGAEEEKGTPELKEVNKRLREIYKEEFVGNVEARYILKSKADVIVADGLMGNVALKALEGAVSTLKNALKEEFSKSFVNKLKGLIVKGSVKKMMKKFNYKESDGAVLLGVKKGVIKVHGSSNIETYEKALFQAKRLLENKIIEKIANELKEKAEIDEEEK